MAELAIDLDDLTIDEIDEIEEIAGEGIDAFEATGKKKGKLLRAIVFVYMKRSNPTFTLEEAGKIKPASLAATNGNGNRAQRRARPTKANV